MNKEADCVRFFLLDFEMRPVAPSTTLPLISNDSYNNEQGFEKYCTEEIVSSEEMTIGGVLFTEQNLYSTWESFPGIDYYELGPDYLYCQYDEGTIQANADNDGLVYEFGFYFDGGENYPDYNSTLPPVGIRDIVVGQHITASLLSLGFTEYATQEFMSHAHMDTDVVTVKIESGMISDITYSKGAATGTGYLSITLMFPDKAYALSFSGGNDILEGITFYNYDKFR